MPGSNRVYDAEIKQRLETLYPSFSIKILDVGPGGGKYRNLLWSYKNMDAVEIWEPYIKQFMLDERYRHVYNLDIKDFKAFGNYDLIIFGDVLEHIDIKNVQSLLSKIDKAGCDVLVAVPFKYEQGECNGNPYEIHKQDDLTHTIFMDRYPGFETIVRDSYYGVYFKKGKRKSDRKEPEREDFKVDKSKFSDVYLAIATPTYGGEVTTAYLTSIWNTLGTLNQLGIKVNLLLADGASVEKGRNMLVARFMQNPDYTHLLFIDNDIGWKPQELLRLIAFDKDVVSVACRKKCSDLSWTVNFPQNENGEVLIEDGLLEAEGIGCGFMLVKRHVFEDMMKAYPNLKVHQTEKAQKSDKLEWWDTSDFGEMYTLFQFEVRDGQYWSEDLTFCHRWREIGGRIWIDPEGNLIHIGQHKFQGALSSVVSVFEDAS